LRPITVYNAHDVTAQNIMSSPRPTPADAMLSTSPCDTTIHTPLSATRIPIQRCGRSLSPNTKEEITIVITGFRAMMRAARDAGNRCTAPMKKRLYANTPSAPSTNVPIHCERVSFGKPRSSTNAATSNAMTATTYRANEPIRGVREASTYFAPTNVPPQIAGTETSRP
jgi:hypothetical protein